MRKSKANPAKYAKGYRKISQRRMTSHGDQDDEEEIQRLRELIRSSYEHLSNQPAFENERDDRLQMNSTNGKKKSKKQKKCTTPTSSISGEQDDNDNDDDNDMNKDENENKNKEIQNELIDDTFECGDCHNNLRYTTDETEMILLPSTRKRKNISKEPIVILTPEEIKAAKNKHKALERKLQQIETRREKKKRRTELYEKISKHAVSDVEMKLLERSSELGKKLSKKQLLKKALQRERAGIELTEEERDLLYVERDEVVDEEVDKSIVEQINIEGIDSNDVEVQPLAFPSSGRKKKKPKKKTAANNDDSNAKTSDKEDAKTSSQENKTDDLNNTEEDTKPDTIEKKPQSFAEMMMAGLSSLKTKATKEKEEEDNRRAIEEAKRLEQERIKEEEERKKRPKYTPSNPLIIKSAAAMGMTPHAFKKGDQSWRILPVNRPEEIKSTRYDLPVSSMEFEIIDSIRNHSVTILCSETGSGKSTQVPQFLYESGITLGNALSKGEDDGLFICVTQPRRVAAVSTAKRVCYEMGHSKDKGQSIQGTGRKGEGNLVAYQTKYESAGVGSKTRIKFMTDGILLQEIKSDLLLRKYAVIVLDEAHERNLNTDVLLGLLSAALPLQRKAALEGSLPPLKVVIMSATLRVEDFTSNGKLFIEDKPNLVKVPGRTFPVTIHHSKTTELDDYEGVALQKVCKIHKKLPPGGILVFLTGKQEIIRMVNRLQRRLKPKTQRDVNSTTASMDVEISKVEESGNMPRDMDDDEADGDLFQKGAHDDDEEEDKMDDFDDDVVADVNKDSDKDDNIPRNVKILPLYSLLSVKEQAKVFEAVDADTRLIVVATNIAETSLTIPGISYVVDTGRQKCRNYHAGTGVASYDVMWISKAAADQRAGRAGRTGPGHCYRIFSSSVYARHLDAFALPEVLTRPLEDVVLAMKAMGISNVGNFPFPTSPDASQLNAAVKLLANIGCVDISNVEVDGGDGEITQLGSAISKLPIGVRYGKMLLIAAQANVLDYGIVMVSVLSEASPFKNTNFEEEKDETDEDSMDGLDEVDKNNARKQEEKKQKENRRHRWCHKGGDVLAGILASGAYSYAGRGAGGLSENLACKRFCDDNSLNPVIMQRIQKMRHHLARLAHQRLGNAEGIAAKTGKVLPSMSPPSTLQERLLRQAIASGLLDNVARRATQGRLLSNGTNIPRTAYLSCRSKLNEPLFIDKKSVIFSRDPRQLPEWICYDSIIRKTTKDGETISTMTNVTPIDPQWLGALADGSHLLSLGEPIDFPTPKYCKDRDEVMCSVVTKYGDQGWLLPPIQIPMNEALRENSKQSSSIIGDDPYRWFMRSLFEGKVFEELKDLKSMLNDDPSIITRKKPVGKVALLVSSLSQNDIDSASKLVQHWAKNDSKFLFKCLKSWVKKDSIADVKRLWIDTVKKKVKEYE